MQSCAAARFILRITLQREHARCHDRMRQSVAKKIAIDLPMPARDTPQTLSEALESRSGKQ